MHRLLTRLTRCVTRCWGHQTTLRLRSYWRKGNEFTNCILYAAKKRAFLFSPFIISYSVLSKFPSFPSPSLSFFPPPHTRHSDGYEGGKADIWSCGVILFVFLSGRLPYDEPTDELLYTKIIVRTHLSQSLFLFLCLSISWSHSLPPLLSISLFEGLRNFFTTRFTIDSSRLFTHMFSLSFAESRVQAPPRYFFRRARSSLPPHGSEPPHAHYHIGYKSPPLVHEGLGWLLHRPCCSSSLCRLSAISHSPLSSLSHTCVTALLSPSL